MCDIGTIPSIHARLRRGRLSNFSCAPCVGWVRNGTIPALRIGEQQRRALISYNNVMKVLTGEWPDKTPHH